MNVHSWEWGETKCRDEGTCRAELEALQSQENRAVAGFGCMSRAVGDVRENGRTTKEAAQGDDYNEQSPSSTDNRFTSVANRNRVTDNRNGSVGNRFFSVGNRNHLS